MIIKEHDRIQHHAGKGFLNKIIHISFRELKLYILKFSYMNNSGLDKGIKLK